MKCPTCATSQKRKDGMTCAKCGYTYAFDPRADGISDGKFLALIRTASAKDTVYFTFNQLYAVYCRGRSRIIAAIVESKLGPLGVFGLVLAIVGGTLVLGGWASDATTMLVVGAALTLGGLVLRSIGRNTRELAPERTEPPGAELLAGWIRKWAAAGKPNPKLLEAPALHSAPAPYRESDIYDYGVERIIIVEHDLLVDLLVKNNQHAEQRALVISETGYPSYLLPHAKRLLDQRPDLPVVLFHDATPQGTQMATRLRRGGLFPLGARKLIDAGLFPKDVPKIRSLDATLPGTYGNAARADFLPFAAMAGGLAGVVGAGVLTSAALAHGTAAMPSDGSSDGGSSGGDGSVALVADGDDGSGAGDFGGTGDGGDADFG